MKIGKKWWWSWASALLVLVAAAAQVPAQGLQVEATAGFDGFYRAGEWVPIFVTINNRPEDGAGLDTIEDFQGHLLLAAQPSDERGTPIRFMRRVEVPRASTKRYILYAKLPGNLQRATLTINRTNGRVVGAPILLDVQSADNDRQILLFITEGDSISAPNLPRLGERLDYFLNTKLNASLLPDHWAAYDSADVIVMSSWPSTAVRPEQIRALSDWVQMGGTLVFLSGADTQTYAGPILESLLPVRLDGTARMWETSTGSGFEIQTEGEPQPRDSEKSYVVAKARPRPGADVILYEDEWPLIVRRQIGSGQILFFASDFKSNSLALDRLLGPYWFALMPSPNIGGAQYEFNDALGSLKTLTGRAARPPNQFVIIIICLIYTLVVGPINFALLGRKKKLEWAWITVPVIVLVFFFLVYGLGRLTKTGENILREISVERYTAGSDLGYETTVAGTFAAKPGAYFVRPLGENRTFSDAFKWTLSDPVRLSGFRALPGGGFTQQRPLTSSSPIIAYEENTSNIYIDSWQMGIYDAATYISRGPSELNGTVDADLQWTNTSVAGSVRNSTEYDFDNSWLIVGNEMLRLSKLDAGGEVEITRDRSLRVVPAQSGQFQLNSVSLFNKASNTFKELQANRPVEEEEIGLANLGVVMEALWHPKQSGDFFPSESGVYFLGFHQQTELEASYSNMHPEITSRSVATLVRLNPVPQPGAQFVVAPPYLSQKLIGYRDPAGRGFQISKDELEVSRAAGFFVFELPFFDPKTRIEAIHFDPVYREDRDPGEEFVFEFFRFPSPQGPAGWVRVIPGQTVRNQNFALPVTGRLFVRVESREKKDDRGSGAVTFNSNNSIQSLGISLVGRVETPGVE